MKKQIGFFLGLGIAVVLVGVVVQRVTSRQSLAAGHAARHAVYYCPMHPTYTSDKPGDCPICSMRLVKREGISIGVASQPAAAAKKDICYMHRCPMVHQGQPCPMLVVAKEGERVTCPICHSHVAGAVLPSAQKRILYWTDPMLPGYQSDKPGKSPMGMDLVPVYEEDASAGAGSPAALLPGYAPILVSPQKQQIIGVKTVPAQTRALTKTVRTVGIIAHDPELYQAEQEFLQAQHAWQQAQATRSSEAAEQTKQLLESTRLRLRHLGISESLMTAIAAASAPDERLLVGGVGESWVYAAIYEDQLAVVKEGQAATITVSALPGKTFVGTVRAIDPIVDPMTRTTRARVLVHDPGGALKPGMYVDVSIAADLGQALAIPEEAVFATGIRNIVFVSKGGGLFEPRDVTISDRTDGYVGVSMGVQAGEVVVTSGNFLIDSESRLKAALQGMAAPQAGTPPGAERGERPPDESATDGRASDGAPRHGP